MSQIEIIKLGELTEKRNKYILETFLSHFFLLFTIRQSIIGDLQTFDVTFFISVKNI